MSGRSGYGRSRIVGKIIHKPANMMMAGLAPRVGKPGWAIRLYYQRVDECFCCMPIKIIRRIFITGNSITDATLASGNKGLKPSVVILGGSTPGAASQAFYGIVFDRKIEIVGASDPATAEVIPLHQVNVAGTDTLITTLTNNDFKTISSSQAWGPVGKTFNINLGDKSTTTNWTTVNQIGGGVSSQLIGSTGGNLSAAYVVTNPNKLGGYALLFNVTQILNSSRTNANNSTAGFNITSNQQDFRSNLLAMTTGGNNISTTYTPGRLTTPESCIPGSLTVSAPVGSFSIADTTGQPPLELLA